MRKILMSEQDRAALVTMLRAPESQHAGASYAEIKLTLPLIERLETVETSDPYVLLEESQWEILCRRVRAAGWTRITREALEMVERVLNAEQVKVREVQQAG